MNHEEVSPPKIDQQTIIEAISFVNSYPDQSKCEQAREVLLTHLPMHENVLDTVKSIIQEYSISADVRMIFIGIAGKMMSN